MVFFDLDGTLIDSNGAWVEVDRQFLAKRGLPHSPDYQEVVIHSIFPIAAQYTKDHFGLSESVEEIMGEWLDMAREIYAHQAPLKPGAKEYLEHLSRRGERMALVTSCIPELCLLALDHHGIRPYFETFTYSTEVGKLKREPDVWLLAAERSHVLPEEVMVFEDSPSSLIGVRTADMRATAVYDPYFADRVDELKELSDGRFIQDYRELLDD